MRVSIIAVALSFLLTSCGGGLNAADSLAAKTTEEAAILKQNGLDLLFAISADSGRIYERDPDHSIDHDFISKQFRKPGFFSDFEPTPEPRKNETFNVELQYKTKEFKTAWSKLTTSKGDPGTFHMFETPPSVHAFSDRPFSVGSEMSIFKFKQVWSESNSFLLDQPNANIVYKTSVGETVTVPVRLLKPQISSEDGTITFVAKPINKSQPGIAEILSGDKTVDMKNVTIFIDGWFSHAWHSFTHTVRHVTHTVVHTVVHTYHHVAHAIHHVVSQATRDLEHLEHTIATDINHDTAALAGAVRGIKNYVDSKADELASAAKEADSMIKQVAEEAGHDIAEGAEDAYDGVKDAVVWLYDSEKCFYIEVGFTITDAVVAGLEAAASGGTEDIEWEAFIAGLKEGLEHGLVAEGLSKGMEKAAEAGGASEDVAECIGSSTEIILGQALEMGSMSALLIDIFKQVTLEKSGCANLFEACFH